MSDLWANITKRIGDLRELADVADDDEDELDVSDSDHLLPLHNSTSQNDAAADDSEYDSDDFVHEKMAVRDEYDTNDDENDEEDDSELDSDEYEEQRKRDLLRTYMHERVDIYVCGLPGSGRSRYIRGIQRKLDKPAYIIEKPCLSAVEVGGGDKSTVNFTKRRQSSPKTFWQKYIEMNIYRKIRNYVDRRQLDRQYALIESCCKEDFLIYVPFAEKRGYLDDSDKALLHNGVKPFVHATITQDTVFQPFRVYIYINVKPEMCLERIKNRNEKHRKTLDSAQDVSLSKPLRNVYEREYRELEDEPFELRDMKELATFYHRIFVDGQEMKHKYKHFVITVPNEENKDEDGDKFQADIDQIIEHIRKAQAKRLGAMISHHQLHDLARQEGILFKNESSEDSSFIIENMPGDAGRPLIDMGGNGYYDPNESGSEDNSRISFVASHGDKSTGKYSKTD